MADQQKHGMKEPTTQKGPTKSQIVAVITLLPVGATLLTFSVLTLAGTVFGLAFMTPLFILFSPVLVPAGLTLALAVTGFLASGAFGVTALSSLSWLFSFVRGERDPPADQIEQAKRMMAGHMGQRGKEVGQGAQAKASEAAGKN